MPQSAAPFTNVYEALLASARDNLDRAAIVFEDTRLTYGQVLENVDNVANCLQSLGIGKGSVFAAYSQNCPELMFCYYAAARLGAVFVPINPNLTSSEVQHVFNHSGARILFYGDFVVGSAKEAIAEDKRRPLSILHEEVGKAGSESRSEVGPDDDFLIIYTSGTTGDPKAIVLDHAAQTRGAAALSTMWGIGPLDTTLVALPLGYLYGLSTAAAVGLQAGGKVVLLRRFHPRDVLEGLVAHQATVFHGVPTMFSMMLNYCEERGLNFDLGSLRALICAGAPMSMETRIRFKNRFGQELQNYYAVTESTPVFGKTWNGSLPLPENAVGRAAPELYIRIVRPDGSDCETGEQGELLVRGAATMKRYMNEPEKTRASFVGNLFRTGDLGYVDAQGNYYITGRIKDIIIRGGANISPLEVEEVLSAHPAVQDVAVVGWPDPTFGEVPVAAIVLRCGKVASERELIEHAEQHLSDFKVPQRYFFENELPLGKTGKTDKVELKKRLEAAE